MKRLKKRKKVAFLRQSYVVLPNFIAMLANHADVNGHMYKSI